MNKKNLKIIILSGVFGLSAIAAIVTPILFIEHNKKQNQIAKEDNSIDQLVISPKFYDFYDTIGTKTVKEINTSIESQTQEVKMSWIYTVNSSSQIINGISSVNNVQVVETANSRKTNFDVIYNKDFVIKENLENKISIINKKIITLNWKTQAKVILQTLIFNLQTSGFPHYSVIESALNTTYGNAKFKELVDSNQPTLITGGIFKVSENSDRMLQINIEKVILSDSERYSTEKVEGMTDFSLKWNWENYATASKYIENIIEGPGGDRKFDNNDLILAEIQKDSFKNGVKLNISGYDYIQSIETRIEQTLTDERLISELFIEVIVSGFNPIELPVIQIYPKIIGNIKFISDPKVLFNEILSKPTAAANVAEVKTRLESPETKNKFFELLTEQTKKQITTNFTVFALEEKPAGSTLYKFGIILIAKSGFSIDGTIYFDDIETIPRS